MIEGISEVNSQQSTSSVQTESKVSGSGMNRDKVLNVILLIMVFIMIGLFGYLFFTDRLIVGVENPFSTGVVENEVGEDVNEDEEIIEEEALSVYTNDVIGISLEYPSDWVITKDVTEEHGGGLESLQLTITSISNPKWSFVYSYPAASEPSACKYLDSEEDFSDILEILELDNYAEVFNSSDEFRRSLSEDKDTYTICKKTSYSSMYTLWANPGFIDYTVDPNDSSNGEMLSILDSITLSLKEI